MQKNSITDRLAIMGYFGIFDRLVSWISSNHFLFSLWKTTSSSAPNFVLAFPMPPCFY